MWSQAVGSGRPLDFGKLVAVPRRPAQRLTGALVRRGRDPVRSGHRFVGGQADGFAIVHDLDRPVIAEPVRGGLLRDFQMQLAGLHREVDRQPG